MALSHYHIDPFIFAAQNCKIEIIAKYYQEIVISFFVRLKNIDMQKKKTLPFLMKPTTICLRKLMTHISLFDECVKFILSNDFN